MPTTYTLASTAEDGISTTGNTVWDSTPTNPTIGPSSTERMGFRFTGFPFDSLGGGGQTSLIYGSMTLNLFTVVVGSGTLRVYVVDEAAPDAFSNARVPGTLDEVLVYEEVDPAGGLVSLSLDIEKIGPVYNRLGWNGALALTLGWESAGGTLAVAHTGSFFNAPTLTAGSEVPFYTGLPDEGRPPGYSRIRICAKTGFLRYEEEMVEDGYFDGMLVRPESYDPPDPDDLPDPIEPFRS